jgi:flagellar hook-length control protein FliK
LQNAAETGSIALTGVAASGLGGGVAGATSPIAPTAAGKTVKDTAAVEAAPSGTGDPAGLAASADGPAKDFLAALADAGQGQTGIPGQVAAPAAQGAPPAAIAPMQNSGPAGTHSAAAPAQASAPAQADPAVPLGQVPMTIGLRSLGGSSEFQIRLDPAELGRIEVKLEIDKARGTVTTHLVVDRPDTLAMLQRDAGQLQQALAQTGLDPSGGGLNLSLRGDGSAQGDGRSGQGDAPRGGPATWSTDTAEATQETAPVRWLRGYGGVDIRI